MKVHVCLSSRLRSSWKVSIPCIVNYFKKYNVDYFITTMLLVVNRYKIWIKSSFDKLYSICLKRYSTPNMNIFELKQLEHKDKLGC